MLVVLGSLAPTRDDHTRPRLENGETVKKKRDPRVCQVPISHSLVTRHTEALCSMTVTKDNRTVPPLVVLVYSNKALVFQNHVEY